MFIGRGSFRKLFLHFVQRKLNRLVGITVAVCNWCVSVVINC